MDATCLHSCLLHPPSQESCDLVALVTEDKIQNVDSEIDYDTIVRPRRSRHSLCALVLLCIVLPGSALATDLLSE